jgi:hypothetical protein
MRFALIPTLGLVLALAGCHDLLDTNPVNQVPTDIAITDAASARVALAGAYDGLQSLSFYGGDYVFLNDLYADNADATGTFNDFADAGARSLQADNPTVTANWIAIYSALNRANNLLQKVPPIADLDDTEKNQILGEARFIRALCLHDLTRVWGNVPMPLVPAADLAEASAITTSTAAAVYTQIIDDLTQAETLMTSQAPTNHATVGAAQALLARVYLYQQNWLQANAMADSLIALGGADGPYELAANYGDLFDPEGKDTPEDIFKVSFTAIDYNDFGYYYLSSRQGHGGRHELSPSDDLIAAYDTTDARYLWSINFDPFEGRKWRTATGAEDIAVIRFAEVLLIKAEALAQQGQLQPAIDQYNLLRERAGLPDHVLNVDVTTQAEVLAAIDHERRVELAMEGDRFPDLVRTGQAETVLGIPAFRTVFPVPQREIDVAPGITQNTGY